MSPVDDDHETESSDILVVKDRYQKPVIHDGNNATIPGALTRCREYWRDQSLFVEYFEHHAVQLINGKTAVDSPDAIPAPSGPADVQVGTAAFVDDQPFQSGELHADQIMVLDIAAISTTIFVPPCHYTAPSLQCCKGGFCAVDVLHIYKLTLDF